MGTHHALKVFEDKRIRTFWNDTEEKWYFSIADVVSALTDSQDVKQYIKRLRARDKELGSVWGTICTPHQFVSTDGKPHSSNCSDLQGIFRIIQSIPSKNAEAPLPKWPKKPLRSRPARRS